MKKLSLAVIALALAVPSTSSALTSTSVGSDSHMLSLSCVEALVAIDEAKLAGVFSFVPEKDAPAAFGDLIVHDKKALKKYVTKLDRDRDQAGGISPWDHDVMMFILQIYASPLADTLEKPGAAGMERLTVLANAPTMQLQEITARRKKK